MKRFMLTALAAWSAAPAIAQDVRTITRGAVDQTVYVRIVDATDGTPETGVTSATSGLDLEYVRNGAAATDLTESDLAAAGSAHSDGGIIHVGAGVYRVDLPDAAVASGSTSVLVGGSVTGMVVIPARVQLAGLDLQTATVNVGQIEGADATDQIGSSAWGYSTRQLTGAANITSWGGPIQSTATGVTVSGFAAGAITNAAFSTGAIDDNAIAANAIGSSQIASNAIGAAEIASDAIGALEVASGAIDADALAADAIGASELAADAGTEIGAAAWASATRTLTAATNITSSGAAVPMSAGGYVQGDMQAILGTALDNTGTGTTFGQTLATNISRFFGSTQNWTLPVAGASKLYDVHSVTTKLDTMVRDDAGQWEFDPEALEEAPTGGGASASAIADAVWDEARSGHVAAGTFGEAVPVTGNVTLTGEAIDSIATASNMAVVAGTVGTNAAAAAASAATAATQATAGAASAATVASKLPGGGRVIAAAGDTATNLDQVSGGGGGAPDTRDLQTPAYVLRLPSRATGRAYVTEPIRIVPGETIRAGVDLLGSIVLPTGAVPASMSTPTGLSGELSATKRGIGNRYANFDVTAGSGAVLGTEQWVQFDLTNSLGQGPFRVAVRVIVVAATAQ